MATLRAEGTIDMVDQGTAKESKVLRKTAYAPILFSRCEHRITHLVPLFTCFQWRERAESRWWKHFYGPNRQLGKSSQPCHIKAMTDSSKKAPKPDNSPPASTDSATRARGAGQADSGPIEIGGPKGPEPTRYGDWEVDGRCSDF
jgi:hypothetical protein